MGLPLGANIVYTRHEVSLTLLGLPDEPNLVASVLGPISDASIDVDMIVSNPVADGRCDFTFTVAQADYPQAHLLMTERIATLGARELQSHQPLVKFAIVSPGLWEHPGITSSLFAALGGEGIAIQLISSSESRLSLVVEESYLEPALRVLRHTFALEQELVGVK